MSREGRKGELGRSFSLLVVVVFFAVMSDSQASASSTPLPRHDFFQSDDKFTLSIFVKGLKPEDVSVSFRERAVSPSSPLLPYILCSELVAARSSSYSSLTASTQELTFVCLSPALLLQMKLTLPNLSTFDISPFPYPVDTEKSTYRVSPVKVEIVLVKKDIGIKWSGLTGEGDHDAGELDAPSFPFLSLSSASALVPKLTSCPRCSCRLPYSPRQGRDHVRRRPSKEGLE